MQLISIAICHCALCSHFVDQLGSPTRIAMVTYKFDGVQEHEVLIRPHGNSSTSKPYYRTALSVRKNLTKALQAKTPKEAVGEVFKGKGGLLGAPSVGQIPRNRKQARNIKYHNRLTGAGGTQGRDILYIMMEQCKAADSKQNRFVQEVTCAPEPMAILASSQQLLDIERFCCSTTQFSIMGIDPTFNLGEFSVTPIVYQHLLVVGRQSGQSPWMLGPILVHYKKEFRNYNFFLSALIGLQHTLTNVRAVGTDGELNLIQAIHQQFTNALHLRCFRHLQGNIERHLQAYKIPQTYVSQYIYDIFGSDDLHGTHHEGLVDSENQEEFFERLEMLQPIWKRREEELSLQIQFHAWFCKHKAEGICSSALRSIREEAGLGSPPRGYYTNPNEAMNRVLKEKVAWKKQQLPEFTHTMKELVVEQHQEVEKAVINGGEYTLRQEFRALEVAEPGKWWRMNEGQRAQFLKKFNNFRLGTMHVSRKGKEKETQLHNSSLSVSVSEAKSMLNAPGEVIEGIWSKSTELLTNPDAMSRIPGSGNKDRFVLSRSSMNPHAVKFQSKTYTCDERCLHFKSLALCSHTVAVAEVNKELLGFLQTLQMRKKRPNLFQLSKHGMPAGAGKKGNNMPRRKTAKSTITGFDKILLNTAMPLTPGPSGSTAPLTSGPFGSSAPLTSGPSGSSAPLTSGPSRSSVPLTSGPSGSTAPLTSGPSGSSVPLTSGPSRSSVPLTLGPSGSSGLLTSGPSGSTVPLTSGPSRSSMSVTSGPSRSMPLTSGPSASSTPLASGPSASSTPLASGPSSSYLPAVYNPAQFTPGPIPMLSSWEQEFIPVTPYLRPPTLSTPTSLIGMQVTTPVLGPPSLLTPGIISNQPNTAPYVLMFLSGNISTCFGCRGNFTKPAIPPKNLVIQHEDYRSYMDKTGIRRQKYGKVYYHLNVSCIQMKQQNFDCRAVIISQKVLEEATMDHSDFVLKQFGVRLF